MAPTLTRRQAITAALASAAAAGLPRFALAQSTPVVAEMSIGDPNAPVTLVEYAMFTCPHCATFAKEVMPRIKENYIDTGKVRLVFREVYFNKPALWAAMIARCAPEDRYFGMVDALFATQASWTGESDEQAMLGKLYGIGRQAGLTDVQMNACMQDRAMAEALVAEYQKNAAADGVDSTPTFLINGKKVDNMPYEEFEAELNAALGA
ncbi:MAG TPA: DsbA family protein [Hyphomicrobiaceae bacterium]